MRCLWLSCLLGLALWLAGPVRAAGDGEVVSLTPSGQNPVLISAEVRVIGNNSNLRFFIYDPGNNVVHTHGPVSVPTLELGQTESFPYSWSWDTPGLGDHRVELCWSSGNSSSNCNIGQANTNFTSVDSLGPALMLLVGALVVLWLWVAVRRIRQPAPQPAL
ncbi:MAG: hypothetical protein HC915_15130 [Anaerolineae bacterium]|nr:hypothetical protein [Anaerolineae bacterium]